MKYFEKLKEVQHIVCPVCGKTLILLENAEGDILQSNTYWCDECGVTILIFIKNSACSNF